MITRTNPLQNPLKHWPYYTKINLSKKKKNNVSLCLRIADVVNKFH